MVVGGRVAVVGDCFYSETGVAVTGLPVVLTGMRVGCLVTG